MEIERIDGCGRNDGGKKATKQNSLGGWSSKKGLMQSKKKK
jgi:hypothetical protein